MECTETFQGVTIRQPLFQVVRVKRCRASKKLGLQVFNFVYQIGKKQPDNTDENHI